MTQRSIGQEQFGFAGRERTTSSLDALVSGASFMQDVQFDFEGADQARGCVSGHAELWRRGQMMLTAIRYDDIYRNTPDGWKIADRTINFPYYMPVAEYPDILRPLDRKRAYDAPKPADFPERLLSWTEYEKSRGRA